MIDHWTRKAFCTCKLFIGLFIHLRLPRSQNFLVSFLPSFLALHRKVTPPFNRLFVAVCTGLKRIIKSIPSEPRKLRRYDSNLYVPSRKPSRHFARCCCLCCGGFQFPPAVPVRCGGMFSDCFWSGCFGRRLERRLLNLRPESGGFFPVFFEIPLR